MSRQINLYSTEFRPKAKLFSATWLLVAVALTATGMTARHLLELDQLRAARARKVEGGEQLKQLQEQVAAMTKNAQKGKDKTLEQEVTRAEEMVRVRQELIGRLQGDELGNRSGFASFLTAFARQRLEGVWLTSVEVSGVRSDFTIEGRSLRADLVPGYIRLLSKEEAIKGRSIATLAMREREVEAKDQKDPREQKDTRAPEPGRPASSAKFVEFRLASRVAETAPGAAR